MKRYERLELSLSLFNPVVLLTIVFLKTLGVPKKSSLKGTGYVAFCALGLLCFLIHLSKFLAEDIEEDIY